MYRVMYKDANQYVTDRDGIYYYVRRVPHDVRQYYASSRISFSLRTKSHQSACLTCCQVCDTAAGGLYAAGGAYINRMSNYCANCRYKVAKKNGEETCPFNYLYRDFLIRNRDKLGGNARMGMMHRSLDRMAPD